MRRGGQRSGHTWDFADVVGLRHRLTLTSEGARGLYLAILENALTECRRFGAEGFRHGAYGRRGEQERQEYEWLLRWLLGGPALVTLQYCCDVLGVDASYVGQGMIRIAQRLGSEGPMPVHGPTSRRYISRGMRVGLT